MPRLLDGRLHFLDGQDYRGRGNRLVTPLRHGQGEFRSAPLEIFRDPHGAVKLDCSTPALKDDWGGQALVRALGAKLD